MPVPAILLAAGASRRLGTPKQALVWEGETLLHRAARVALEAGFSPVIVVVGAAAEVSRQALGSLDVQVVSNPEWEEGMGASIRAGMGALPQQAEAVLLLVCDQPALSVEHLQALLRLHEEGQVRVIASLYSGVRGVPALFSGSCFADLNALSGDKGARGLLLGPEVLEVLFPEGALDVDTPLDCESFPKNSLKFPSHLARVQAF